MEQIYRISILMFLFSISSIFAFTIRKKCEKKIKFERDAQKFFETVCQKVLTPFHYPSDPTIEVESRAFEISGTNFLIIKVISGGLHSRQEVVESFEFLGRSLVHNKTGKTLSYSCFEAYLRKLASKELISGYYIESVS